MRIALGLAYVGSTFAGWQWQPNIATVQGTLEQALTKIANHPVRVVCAGRTDQGVHAANQVIHFDTHCERPETIWIAACNYYLPSSIRILWAKITTENFHARFSALSRTYQYLIYQGMMPWMHNRALIYNRYSLNQEWMQQASHFLIGKHDFSAFRASSCQAKSPVRCIHQLKVCHNAPWLTITITANAFLHHMVRNIVGILIDIGQGKHPVDWIIKILKSRNRAHGTITAEPQGLYLQKIEYPLDFKLPQMPEIFILDM